MGSTVNSNIRINRRGKPRNRIGYLKSLTCKRNLGHIVINESKYCLDQISEEDNVWFYRKEKYLMETYGITVQQYYNICMYGSVFRTPLCKYCGSDLQFRELNYGYYPVCKNKNCKSRYRSEGEWLRTESLKKLKSERFTRYNNEVKWNGKTKEERCEMTSSWRNRKIEYNNESLNIKLSRTKRIKNSIQNLVNKLIGKNLYHAFRSSWKESYIGKSKFVKYSFLLKGNLDDVCYFYIATTDKNEFKYGVTSNISERKRLGSYKNIKCIFKSSRLIVAELEYQVKMNMMSSSEFMNWHDVRKFMNSYKISIKFIRDRYLTNIDSLSSTTISKESTLQVNNGNGNSKNPIISDYDIVSSM